MSLFFSQRKAKYEEVKRLKAEKAEKRQQRNEQLRLDRKKKKEEEARKREAYEKRMAELKASFLGKKKNFIFEEELTLRSRPYNRVPQKNPSLSFFFKKHKNLLVLCPELTQKKLEPF